MERDSKPKSKRALEENVSNRITSKTTNMTTFRFTMHDGRDIVRSWESIPTKFPSEEFDFGCHFQMPYRLPTKQKWLNVMLCDLKIPVLLSIIMFDFKIKVHLSSHFFTRT